MKTGHAAMQGAGALQCSTPFGIGDENSRSADFGDLLLCSRVLNAFRHRG
jgi:hypothetical protein